MAVGGRRTKLCARKRVHNCGGGRSGDPEDQLATVGRLVSGNLRNHLDRKADRKKYHKLLLDINASRLSPS